MAKVKNAELESSHEEADTRLILHMQHASNFFSAVVCVADDTDVFILCLSFCKGAKSDWYLKPGSKNRTKLISLQKIAESLGGKMLNALIGLHSFTGCDTVSAFANQGKVKGLKLTQQNEKYQEAFSELGANWLLSETLAKDLERFTCELYAKGTKVDSVNELRYQIFSVKKADSSQLPPCFDSLKQHMLRAHYQAALWRRSLDQKPEIPNPTEGFGWTWSEDGSIAIKWMTGSPAPQAVLNLLSCQCSKSCTTPACTCVSNNLKCTAACKLKDCDNSAVVFQDEDEQEPCSAAETVTETLSDGEQEDENSFSDGEIVTENSCDDDEDYDYSEDEDDDYDSENIF